MVARTHIGIALVGLVAVGACVPAVGPNQVAVGVFPPPTAYEDMICKHVANGYVRIYVVCMEQHGHRVELIGQGGVPMSIAELPLSPPPPMPSPQYPYRPPPEAPQPPAEAPSPPPSPPEPSPSASEPQTGSITPEQEHVLKTLEAAAGQAIVSCGSQAVIKHLLHQESHGVRCFVITTLINSYKTITQSEIKSAVCSNPDILQRVPLITPDREKEISDELGCSV